VDIEKVKKEYAYSGKPKQWQMGFDALAQEIAAAIGGQLEQHVGLCDEECILIAHATGDGWHLAVLNRDGVEIAMLDFNKVIPKQFNGYITASELRNLGYEIV